MEVGMEVLAQATDHKPVAVGAAAADGGAAAGADGGAEGAVVPAEPKDAIVTDLDKCAPYSWGLNQLSMKAKQAA